MAFWEHVTVESVCSRVHAPQKQLWKSIKRALADDEGLLSRWTGRMLFASVTELWADGLPMEVTGIPLVFFVWSWALLDNAYDGSYRKCLGVKLLYFK